MRLAEWALFLSAALLLSNTAILTRGSLDHVTLQSNRLAVAKSNVSHNVVERAVANPPDDRKVIQEYLDMAIVEEKVRRIWDELKKGPQKKVTEEDTGKGKRVTFEKASGISLKEAFQLMQYYPLIYGEEKHPTEFKVPVGEEVQKFQLTGNPDGPFLLEAVRSDGTKVDLSNLQNVVGVLSDSSLEDALKKTIQEVSLNALDAELNNQPNFEDALKNGDVSKQKREDAFRAARDVLAGTSVQRKSLAGSNLPSWLQKTNEDISLKMKEVRKKLSKEIAKEGETKLKFEFVQSMLKTREEAKDSWEKLKTKKVIEEVTTKAGNLKKVKIHPTNEVTLKDIFRLLQFYPDIFENQGYKHTTFEVPIGGETRKFRLSTSTPRYGVHQIAVYTSDEDWPGTTKRGRGGKGGEWAPDYKKMLNEVLKPFSDHDKLANSILAAADSKLDSQPDFSKDLNIPGKNTETADTTRAAVEFMVISMIAEAAQPTDEFKAKFLKDLADNIRKRKRFPESGVSQAWQN